MNKDYDYYDDYKERMTLAIKEGKEVFFGSISSEGDPMEQLLYSIGFSNIKDVEVDIIEEGC